MSTYINKYYIQSNIPFVDDLLGATWRILVVMFFIFFFSYHVFNIKYTPQLLVTVKNQQATTNTINSKQENKICINKMYHTQLYRHVIYVHTYIYVYVLFLLHLTHIQCIFKYFSPLYKYKSTFIQYIHLCMSSMQFTIIYNSYIHVFSIQLVGVPSFGNKV